VAEARAPARLTLDCRASAVEGIRINRLRTVTALAHEVLTRARAGERVHARTVTQMKMAQQPKCLKGLEVAVDRGEVRTRNATVESAGDLLGRERLIGPVERLEHQAPGGRNPQSTGPERGNCGLHVGRVDGWHVMGVGHVGRFP
jgi:hypothetical protein